MSTLFRAEVLSVEPRAFRVQLRVVSAEVRQLWLTKSFALSLLLEPIFFRQVEAPAELAAVISRAEIDAFDTGILRTRAAKVITSCNLVDLAPVSNIAEHLDLITPMDSDAIREYFADEARAPRATFHIKVKTMGMANHMRPSLAWDSVACDMI